MKITKEDLHGVFKRFVKAIGQKIDAGSYDGLSLENAPIYGGYLVVQYGPLGSESHPFGHVRLKAKEMYFALAMACDALDYKKQQQEQLNKYEIA